MTEAGPRGDREGASVRGSRSAGNSLVSANFPGTLATALDPHPSPQPDSATPYPRITLKDLFNIATWQDEIPWQPFRDGVDIHRLYGDGKNGPTAALIRFREAGKVPPHEHTGYEHIFVLAGSQRDNNGTTEAGSLIISPPGTQHSIVSEAGCIVLAIYEKPVRFL
ncbi:MAG: cupin domain-containing protein, partial [Chthoniobacteraceae bacterium]